MNTRTKVCIVLKCIVLLNNCVLILKLDNLRRADKHEKDKKEKKGDKDAKDAKDEKHAGAEGKEAPKSAGGAADSNSSTGATGEAGAAGVVALDAFGNPLAAAQPSGPSFEPAAIMPTMEELGFPILLVDASEWIGHEVEYAHRHPYTQLLSLHKLPSADEVLDGIGIGPSGPPVPPPANFAVVSFPEKRPVSNMDRTHYVFVAASPDDPYDD